MSKLALSGGKAVRSKPYPEWPVHDERDITAVTDVIHSGRWGGHPYPGPQTAQLIEHCTEMYGSAYAIPIANCSLALEIALRVAGVGWQDEVILPTYTFVSSATSIIAVGAIPILVDIDPHNFAIDPKAIEAAITPQTKAIMPVHLGSQIPNMDAIMAVANKHNLLVIEDAAQAHGSKWRDKSAGTIGHLGALSFQSAKTVSVGEGGILLCQTAEHEMMAASLIDCGRPKDQKGESFNFGVNYRMTELQSALANVALRRFPEQARQREKMATYLEEKLQAISGVRLLKRDPHHTSRAFFFYMLAIDPDIFGAERDMVCLALMLEGIPCSGGYEPLHRSKLYQPRLSKLPVPTAFPERFNMEQIHLPVAEKACSEEIIWLDERVLRDGIQGVDDVVEAVEKVQANAAQLDALKAYKSMYKKLANAGTTFRKKSRTKS